MVEFTWSDEIRNWLEGQTQDVAFVIAARCALRVQPFLARVITADRPEQMQKAWFLDSFRAVHSSCVAAVYPNQVAWASQNTSTKRAFNAYFKASEFWPDSNAFSFAELNYAKAGNAVNAANAANAAYAYDHLKAAAALHAAAESDPLKAQFSSSGNVAKGNEDFDYREAVVDAVTAEAATAQYVAAKAADPTYIDAGEGGSDWAHRAGYKAKAAVWTAVSSDCSKTEIMDPTSLLGTPIWPDGWPNWFETEMTSYFAALASPEWDVWKLWYRGMLDGDTLDWAAQREIAQIPNVNWEAGPERISDIFNGGPVEQEPVEQEPILRSSSPPAPH